MRKLIFVGLLSIALVPALSLLAVGDDPAGQTGGTNTNQPGAMMGAAGMQTHQSTQQQDQNFIRAAASTINFHQKVADLASKSDNQQIKDFGKMLSESHDQQWQQLQQVAQKLNVDISDSKLIPPQQGFYDWLSKLSGQELDTALPITACTCNTSMVLWSGYFQQASTNADLRNYAGTCFQEGQKHLARSEQLVQSVTGVPAMAALNTQLGGEATPAGGRIPAEPNANPTPNPTPNPDR